MDSIAAPASGREGLREQFRGAAQIAVFCAVAATVWRSLTPLIEGWLTSDEALVGLMAKHLGEGRAFPLFLYSLPHILGITSWIAAPFIAVGGTTVAMLKLPVLLMNVAIAWLLVDRLQRDVGLHPASAFLAAAPFVLAPPDFSYRYYLDAAGGSPEPILFVLLLWMSRNRPVLFGILLGVGILNRPFAAYGAAALVVVQCVDKSILQRRVWRNWGIAALAAVAVFDLVYAIRVWSSPAGPGTSFDATAIDTVGLTMGFVCFDPARVLTGIWQFMSDLLPRMVGAKRSLSHMPYVVIVAGVVSGARLLWLARDRTTAPGISRLPFTLYLTVVGVLSAAVYVAARCGFVDEGTMRYAMLTPLAFVGLVAMIFALETRRMIRHLLAVVLCAWALVQFIDHTQWTTRAMAAGQTGTRHALARYLQTHHIRYAWADYWDALVLTYLTGEAVIVASENVSRVETYLQELNAHSDAAVHIRHRPCARQGVEAVPGVYWLCDE